MAAHCPDFAALLREAPPDKAIWEQVAQCFAGELSRQARNRCRDPALADDAAQDALITAFEALRTYRGDGPIDRWLHRLVVTSCSRLRRGKKNDPTLHQPFEDDQHPTANGETQAETQTFLRERFALLERALGDLNEENREIFLRREAHEESIDELAIRFGTSKDAIKGRLKRARSQLRRRLIALAEGDHPDQTRPLGTGI
jgi:RNA polymerase sigma-70 factor, ECF subfamily